MTERPFIIDAVAHGYNFQKDNWNHEEYANAFSSALYGSFHKGHQPANEPQWHIDQDRFMNRQANADLVGRSLFEESLTDMAIYHPIPYFGAFRDGGSPISVGIKLRELYPERVLLYGPISPVREGGKEAVDRMVDELGVVGIKFYPLDIVDGEYHPVRLNDEEKVMPIIEHARKRGITNIAIHKGVPLGPTPIDTFKLEDMDSAIKAFPDMNFQLVHGGSAFLEETAYIMQIYPNVYINMEAPTTAYLNVSPDRFAEIVGTLLRYGGEDKILWSSGAASVHARPMLERFMDFQIPERLQEGYGYPPLTDDIKRKILGENAARLFGFV